MATKKIKEESNKEVKVEIQPQESLEVPIEEKETVVVIDSGENKPDVTDEKGDYVAPEIMVENDNSVSEESEQETEKTESFITDYTKLERKKDGYKKSNKKVVTIDPVRKVQTEADKAREDLIDLLQSLRVGKMLTGTIEGVEMPSDICDKVCAVVYYGEFKVLIPADECIENCTENGQSDKESLYAQLNKRLGAEIDFMIEGVDQYEDIAIASRLKAMRKKRERYYFEEKEEGTGYNLLYDGVRAESRVVSVIKSGIFVDIFGIETFIPAKELSYQRVLDAQTMFQSGQRVLVKLLKVTREEKKEVSVTASVKQADSNPYEKAMRKFTVGNKYVGTVSMVTASGVFVALTGGIDCLCSIPKYGARPTRGSKVTVKILGMNKESNRIWGAITHTAMSL